MTKDDYYLIGEYECKVTMLEELHEFCKNKKIYIYGPGEYGLFVFEQLLLWGVEVVSFLVTDEDNLPDVKCINEKPVITLEQLIKCGYTDNFGVVICSGRGYGRDMAHNLEKLELKPYMIFNVDYKRKQAIECSGKYCADDCYTDFRDGLLRLRITNRCPGKCDFCGQKSWSEYEQNKEMNPDWYYKYLRTLYTRLKAILITGGDSFYASESYRFMEMISKEYPHITILTESNGLTFNEKFQHLACDNLFATHFSLNASCASVYTKGCWSSYGGEKAYNKCIENVDEYLKLLEKKGRLCFAPNVSMVINRYTADDIINFVKMALVKRFSFITFYFDYRENDMSNDYFALPEIGRKALKILMELEMVLKDNVYIDFRLWIPLKELSLMEKEIAKEDLEELRDKYSDLIALAADRNVESEHNERNMLRRKFGKKELTFEEDLHFTLQTDTFLDCKTCWAPWKLIDIYPNGRLDFCSWHKPTLYFPDYIDGDKFDVDNIINSEEFRTYRANMLNGDYDGCMKCCPIINSVRKG